MQIERTLLSKCVAGGLVEALVSRQIAPHHFEDELNQAVYAAMIRHMSKYGAPPSRDVVLAEFPSFKIELVQDALEYLIDQFVVHVQRREAQRAVLDIAQQIDLNGKDVSYDTLFMQYAERVAQAIPSTKISKLSDAKTRLDRYKLMQQTGRIPGIPFGIPTIDECVLGVQKHELVVVSAPSSVGKSTILQHIALQAYLEDPGHRPVFISLEMEGDPLLKKFDTMAVNFEHRALKALELGVGDLEKWETWGERVANAPNDIIILDEVDECSVERVAAEILRWKPSAMFVDYFGIMTPVSSGRDSKTYEGMANMAKALKRVPRRTLTPVFTAAQTNRAGFKEGVRADNIADTIEIFRSADIMLGLERDEEDDPLTMTAKLVKNRDGKKVHTEMHCDFDHMDFYEKGRFQRKPQLEVVPAVPDLSENPFAIAERNGSNPFMT